MLVTASGRLCLHRKRIHLSPVPAGLKLGIKEVDDSIWLVSFMHDDLGSFESRKPCNPSTTRSAVVTHVGGTVCYRCVRAKQL